MSASICFGHFSHNSNTLTLSGMVNWPGTRGTTLSRTTIPDICLVATVGPSRRHHRAWQLDWGSLGKVWASYPFFFLFITLLFAGGVFLSYVRFFVLYTQLLTPY